MKRKYFSITIFGAIILAVFSCAKEYNFTLKEFFIAFSTDTLRVEEGRRANFDLILAAPSPKNDIEVEFSFTSPDGLVQGLDYTVLEPMGNKVTFENSGSQEIRFRIQTVRSFFHTGPRILEVNLLNNSEGFLLGTPGPDKRAKTIAIVLEDLDCPWEFSSFIGTKTIRDSLIVGGTTKTYSAPIVANPTTENSLIITGLWKWKVESFPEIYNLVKDATVTINVEYSSDGRTLLTIPDQFFFTHPTQGAIWIREEYLSPTHKVGLNTCTSQALVAYRIYRKSSGSSVDHVYSTWKF